MKRKTGLRPNEDTLSGLLPDPHKRIQIGKVLLTFLLFLFLTFLLLDPSFAAKATADALLFFGKTVFPSLFLILCLSPVLPDSRAAGCLYRFPFGVEATVWLLGLLCGFPIGARSALQLYESGRIGKKRAEFLCSFTNSASLPFLTGVVGGRLHGSVRYGVKLALLQAASSLLVCFAMYFALRPDCGGIPVCAETKPVSLVSRITSGCETALKIGGMLIFFGVAGEAVLLLTGLSGFPAALLRSVFEFSSGCACAALLPFPLDALCTGFAVGFSGLCVAAQVAALTGGKLSLRPFFLGKALQAAILPALLLLL